VRSETEHVRHHRRLNAQLATLALFEALAVPLLLYRPFFRRTPPRTANRCPPTAEALLYGVMLLQKKIRRTGTIERFEMKVERKLLDALAQRNGGSKHAPRIHRRAI
jgi:hypothetical protein